MESSSASLPPVPRTSSKAVWSLILGILALVLTFVCIGPLFAIPAVILGHMAHSRIKRSSGELTGSGLALGGLITGYISIGLSFFMIPMMAAIAIPNFVKARDTAQRNACINNLRQIESAKQQWALENGESEDALPTALDLDPLLRNGFGGMTCPKGGTYSINPVGEAPTCSIPGHTLPPLPSSKRHDGN